MRQERVNTLLNATVRFTAAFDCHAFRGQRTHGFLIAVLSFMIVSILHVVGQKYVSSNHVSHIFVTAGGLLDELPEDRVIGGVSAGTRGTFGFFSNRKSPDGPILRSKVRSCGRKFCSRVGI